MRNNKVLLVCLIGLAMLLVGCGSDVHKVIIEPSAERVDMDEELILTAIGFDEEGRMMALDTRAYWSLSDEHMGDIKAVSRDQAVFIPIREGSVTIYVKVGKATGNLTVDVGQKIIAVRADKYIDTNSKISKLNDSAYPAIVQTNQEGSWIAWEIELPRKSFYTPVILYACDKEKGTNNNKHLHDNTVVSHSRALYLVQLQFLRHAALSHQRGDRRGPRRH